MEEPSFPLFAFPHRNDVPLINYQLDSDDDVDRSPGDPDIGLHKHVRAYGEKSKKVRMPVYKKPVNPGGILYDGHCFHSYNRDFYVTYQPEAASVIPHFKGVITPIGVPSEITFYNRDEDFEYIFGSVNALDIRNIRVSELSRYQKALFPPEYQGDGMDCFVDPSRAIRLATYVWKKIPFEDIITNFMRRVEVIRIQFDEYDDLEDEDAQDELKRKIMDLSCFLSIELSVINNLFNPSIIHKHYLASLYFRVLVLSSEWYIGLLSLGLPSGRPSGTCSLRSWDLPHCPDVSDQMYDMGYKPLNYPIRPSRFTNNA